ncbi:hypothetical protein RW080711_181 [Synechococcus phage S-RIM8]|uniref:Uncharacterized protein n=2 Tax=Neptunevirus srim18 TaxID=2734121 RepID=A0A1D7SC30_9CAUD|nr:hypothetical protein SXDG_00172 [Synechococcus phage S-RIM8 A.HR1]YP_009783090.1 hypothetical protein HOQ82_gp064 [Synechococcus phage S-RIM8]AFB15441.1 hypothetical protein SWSG_00123 [Synechococcus phage S-RIM8 A.HR5]AFB17876.1 hypothetical protein SXEG_00082 [Synechococcus phage S-RIM8 A.HR3]AGH57870.1 hypothetical protein CPJG_00118 [Synechococcus phage KBS-M-1A]AFB17666.1 hypothetical protein SXDG_00172 [Synechococcus phage S-RIM8 A.HR1]AOO10768.1 hypothetical protein RW060613_180 [Sy
MATTEDKESLQVLAMALRQEKGSALLDTDLSLAMQNLNGQPPAVRDACVINYQRCNRSFAAWLTQNDVGGWVNSSVWIANKVYPAYMRSGRYKFYRQDFVPGFKGTFNRLKNDIKQTTTRSVMKQMYDVVTVGEDKWNPADIIAIKDSESGRVLRELADFNPARRNAQSRKLQEENAKIRAKGEGGKMLHAMEDLDGLYEYNQFIDELFKTKTCVGISLKKATDENVKMKVMRHSGVKGLKDALAMNIVITDVEYSESNQKCVVNFTMSGRSGHYLDIRGFESSRAIADIQVQLSQRGGSAAHGKVTLPVISLIARRSGGGRAFMQIKSQRTRIFQGVQHARSNIHNFTDWRVFDNYRARGGGTNLVADLPKWAQYIAWLSRNQHSSGHVVDHVTQLLAGRNGTFNAAKYLKHKVQAYEVGYLLDKEQNNIREDIKNNIIKSMIAYAGSKGLIVFTDRRATAFMKSSTYLKVGG